MKYLKLYENYNVLDPYDEEDWNEIDSTIDGTFLNWLVSEYPDKTEWSYITEIDCNSNHLTDLNGIDQLIRLEMLFCENNELTSLKGVENLKYLKEISCEKNQITDISSLSNLNNLELLNISSNKLTTLNDIKNLTNITELLFSHNRISDLNQISGFIKLVFLHFNNNDCHDLSIINNFTKLQYLSFSNNYITSVNFNNLEQLSFIDMEHNSISTFYDIEFFKGLRQLYLSHNNLSVKHKNYIRGYCKSNNIELSLK